MCIHSVDTTGIFRISGKAVDILLLSADTAPAASGSLSLIVQLVAVLIWPLVVLVFVLTQRRVLMRLFSAIALLAESANRIKLWQVEIERNIDQEVDRAAKASQGDIAPKPDIPKQDVLAATRVGTLVTRLPDSPARAEILNSVKERMRRLADEYDNVRETMGAGQERTVAMNEIAAQMRTLAIAAKPWLAEFSNDEDSAGVRLCAITILQMAPDSRYLDWLGERFEHEHPFIFYQASIALMAAVQAFRSSRQRKLHTVITSALEKLKSFTGGIPDENSIAVLEQALKALGVSG